MNSTISNHVVPSAAQAVHEGLDWMGPLVGAISEPAFRLSR